MSYEPVGVVIVGTGLIARFHAQAVNASEKLRLVAVVNPTEGHGDAFAAEFGGSFLQHPKGQQSLAGIFRCRKLRQFSSGQQPGGHAQINISIHFFRINANGPVRQHTERMTLGVSNGKMPG